jgi:hypothetical protein
VKLVALLSELEEEEIEGALLLGWPPPQALRSKADKTKTGNKRDDDIVKGPFE